jgi:hypothetical protein
VREIVGRCVNLFLAEVEGCWQNFILRDAETTLKVALSTSNRDGSGEQNCYLFA